MLELSSIVSMQREYFESDATRDISVRKNALEVLLQTIIDHKKVIFSALRTDLGKSEPEAYIHEVAPIIESLEYTLDNLDKWCEEKKFGTSLFNPIGREYIIPDPQGLVLLITPWNMPFYMPMIALISAVAAGNCVVVKPSKNSPYSTQALVDIINDAFEKRHVYALEAPLPYDDIINQDYNHIFFAGSERVGRLITGVGSKPLVQFTLMVGGKCPCIIHESANPDLAARKIMWGKITNAGQSIVAPDYVVVPKALKEKLIERLRFYSREMIGDLDETMNSMNEETMNLHGYVHIINLHHYIRLKNIIEDGEKIIGGRYDDEKRQIEPAIIPDADFDSHSMKDEIFGPILPVIAYEDVEIMLNQVKQKGNPIAVYLFSEDKFFNHKIINSLSFGTCAINECMLQMYSNILPFGGNGKSGFGKINGKAGFDNFTNYKTIFRNQKEDHNLYPPFTTEKYKNDGNGKGSK